MKRLEAEAEIEKMWEMVHREEGRMEEVKEGITLLSIQVAIIL